MSDYLITAGYLIAGLFCARSRFFERPPREVGYDWIETHLWSIVSTGLAGAFWPLWLIVKALAGPLKWFFTSPETRQKEKDEKVAAKRKQDTADAYAAAINLYRNAAGDKDLIRLAKMQLEIAESLGHYEPVDLDYFGSYESSSVKLLNKLRAEVV